MSEIFSSALNIFSVGRIDDTFGDKNLVCTCPPMEEYLSPYVVRQEAADKETELAESVW